MERPPLTHRTPVSGAEDILREFLRSRWREQAKRSQSWGSYWKGPKLLILNKAWILGALLPATNNRLKDLEIFELLMGIEDVTALFTDQKPDPEIRDLLSRANVELHVADDKAGNDPVMMQSTSK